MVRTSSVVTVRPPTTCLRSIDDLFKEAARNHERKPVSIGRNRSYRPPTVIATRIQTAACRLPAEEFLSEAV